MGSDLTNLGDQAAIRSLDGELSTAGQPETGEGHVDR
jgi:hypothetical protein